MRFAFSVSTAERVVGTAWGVLKNTGDAIGRSGNTDRALEIARSVDVESARQAGARLAQQLIDLIEQDVTGLVEVLETVDGLSLQVGIRGIKGSELVTRALANEFGTRTIPERSFLRSTVDRNRERYGQLLEAASQSLPDGGDIEPALRRIGAIVVGDVQRTITELRQPPNAVSTIMRKGSANPLIDTGAMRAAIDFVIVRGPR